MQSVVLGSILGSGCLLYVLKLGDLDGCFSEVGGDFEFSGQGFEEILERGFAGGKLQIHHFVRDDNLWRGVEPHSSRNGGWGAPISLTPGFSNDGDLHAQGAQDRIDRFKARVCARAQGLVEALPA